MKCILAVYILIVTVTACTAAAQVTVNVAPALRITDTRTGFLAAPSKLAVCHTPTGVWRELQRAAEAAGIGHIATHAFRHTYRSWLDAVGTPVAVQQKMMRHSDIRTTMNIYGDVVTDEMTTATSKVARLAFRSNGAQTERVES